MKEGVIKFEQNYRKSEPLDFDDLKELNAWRRIFYLTKLIGMNSKKYGGVGYGNLSQRLPPYNNEKHKKKFAITGTQTGGLDELVNEHYSIVLEYFPNKNLVVSEGPIKASSESMSHGIIYDLDDSARFVFHAHSHEIWKNSEKLMLPTTKESVEYGTPQMTEEVQRLFRESNLAIIKIFSMKGHEDGIVSFGKTAEEAGNIMINYLARAFRLC